jgi:hypothetical protein
LLPVLDEPNGGHRKISVEPVGIHLDDYKHVAVVYLVSQYFVDGVLIMGTCTYKPNGTKDMFVLSQFPYGTEQRCIILVRVAQIVRDQICVHLYGF